MKKLLAIACLFAASTAAQAAMTDCSTTIVAPNQPVQLITAANAAKGALVQNINTARSDVVFADGTSCSRGVRLVHSAAFAGQGICDILHVPDQSSDRRWFYAFGNGGDGGA